MPTAYLVVKWLHVLLAIAAVGVNATYPILIARAQRSPSHVAHVLRSVRFLDNAVANPAYVLLLVTGGLLVEFGGWSWTAPWLLWAILLYVVLAALGLAVYSPLLKRQIAACERHGPDHDEYMRLATRSSVVGAVLFVIALAIVFVMVTKPVLWVGPLA